MWEEIILTMEEIFDEQEQVNTGIKKCPSCGANLKYDAETQKLICEYCNTTVDIDMSHISREQAFEKLFQKNNDWNKEARVFRCSNCGANTVISSKEISKNCPFCGTSNVVQTDEIVGLRPNAVVPFKITQTTAIESYIKWIKKSFWAPQKFKKNVEPNDVYANYIPSFTFDTDVLCKYHGRLGEHYQVTVMVNGKPTTKTKTRWFPISGTFKRPFNDLLVQASSKISSRDMGNLEPFGTERSQQYSDEFLHGFTATQYTKSGETCWNEAVDRMKVICKREILKKYTYDEEGEFVFDTFECNNRSFKYVLLPLYIGHTEYRKKLYNFFVNGETGKPTGKVPKSVFKVTTAVIIGLGILAAIIYLIITKG